MRQDPIESEGTRLRPHGIAGIAIVLTAEALLFSGNELVGRWFTPIVWSGYILFADSLVFRAKGTSLLTSMRSEFLIIAVISVLGWWLFEFYNAPRFWRSELELWWHYHNLEPDPFLRRAGYDWAFATIFPALFLTAELIRKVAFPGIRNRRAVRLSKPQLYVLIAIGAIGAAVPLVLISPWLVPLVWLSLILLLDPVNALRGAPSIAGDLARGDYSRLAALLTSGAICGVLWEFWNFWATTRWTYTVPYLGHIKLFEMPVLGYLGFPPFAVECWAMYVFIRTGVLGGASWNAALASESLFPDCGEVLDNKDADREDH